MLTNLVPVFIVWMVAVGVLTFVPSICLMVLASRRERQAAARVHAVSNDVADHVMAKVRNLASTASRLRRYSLLPIVAMGVVGVIVVFTPQILGFKDEQSFTTLVIAAFIVLTLCSLASTLPAVIERYAFLHAAQLTDDEASAAVMRQIDRVVETLVPAHPDQLTAGNSAWAIVIPEHGTSRFGRIELNRVDHSIAATPSMLLALSSRKVAAADPFRSMAVGPLLTLTERSMRRHTFEVLRDVDEKTFYVLAVGAHGYEDVPNDVATAVLSKN